MEDDILLQISIHALLAESDGKPHKLAGQKLVFLSTLSLRRATFSTFLPIRVVLFLSTLSLRRATIMTITICTALKFLSTLSLRRATPNPVCIMITIIISIHALLAESDQRHPQTLNHPHNFYPRSPCGERRYWSGVPVVGRAISIHALLAESDPAYTGCHSRPTQFLSTLSLRRATGAFNQRYRIHTDFYPRSPCGERPGASCALP